MTLISEFSHDHIYATIFIHESLLLPFFIIPLCHTFSCIPTLPAAIISFKTVTYTSRAHPLPPEHLFVFLKAKKPFHKFKIL